MYKAVPDHPKFLILCSLLKLNRAAAAGHLEFLWHLAGQYAPAGDVGRFSDAEIEGKLAWEREPGALIAALVTARWLDRDETHRLVVHHWSHWADENVHTQLARKCEPFADGTVPHSGRLNQTERARFNAAFSGREIVLPLSRESADTQPQISRQSAASQPKSASAPVFVPVPVPEKNNNNPLSPTAAPMGPGGGGVLLDQTDEAKLAAMDQHLSAGRREQRKQERAAVRRLFEYYQNATERNPKLYTLTRGRLDKGMSRLEDCLRKCGGDMGKAEKLMGVAIDAMLASEFHQGKNSQRREYSDWSKHLFPSTEKIEWWLAR